MDLAQVDKRRTTLLQMLLLIVMVFLGAVTYVSVSESRGLFVPIMTALSLAGCLFVIVGERRLRALHQQLIQEIGVRDDTISERDRTIGEREQAIDALDRQLANLREQSHQDRIESIATVVAGQAHEITTPISAARTAGQMAARTAKTLVKRINADDAETAEALEELTDACTLLERNLDRSFTLIKAFRNQSARQLSDEAMIVDFKEVITDCIYAMRPETKKNGVTINLHAPENKSFMWHGYPGKLTQVIVNLIQNVLRHAYPEGGGKVDVRLAKEPGEKYLIEFQDYGAGIPPDVLPRVFDAMVTTARDRGGTGLGMSITRDIITTDLKGEITCESELGKGTTITIRLPQDIRDDEGSDNEGSDDE